MCTVSACVHVHAHTAYACVRIPSLSCIQRCVLVGQLRQAGGGVAPDQVLLVPVHHGHELEARRGDRDMRRIACRVAMFTLCCFMAVSY